MTKPYITTLYTIMYYANSLTHHLLKIICNRYCPRPRGRAEQNISSSKNSPAVKWKNVQGTGNYKTEDSYILLQGTDLHIFWEMTLPALSLCDSPGELTFQIKLELALLQAGPPEYPSPISGHS